MKRNRFTVEQIFRMLREAEVHLSAGQERKVLLADGSGKGCPCGTAVVKRKDSPPAENLQTLFERSVFNQINKLTGGGGGNRTRVRESSAQDVYMLISSFYVSSGKTPSK
jgi:hypothetical protein